MTKKRKIIVLSCMIALLAVTAIFNFVLTTESIDSTEASASSASYFSQYRLERITTRNEELLQIDDVIANASTDSGEYAKALSLKTDIAVNTERELLLESLIKAYGFEDVVVVIGLESDSVNVIAKSQELTTDDAVLIYTVISEEISVSPENVKIIPIS